MYEKTAKLLGQMNDIAWAASISAEDLDNTYSSAAYEYEELSNPFSFTEDHEIAALDFDAYIDEADELMKETVKELVKFDKMLVKLINLRVKLGKEIGRDLTITFA
jgi:hypothetical protein